MGRASTILVRWVAPILALVAVLGVAFVLFAPRLVSIEVVRRSMSREIAGWSGRSMTFEGTPEVAFTPFLTVTFPKARIESARDGTLLVDMDALRAQVPLLPLIFRGRIEPSSFTFRKPHFRVSRAADGTTNWDYPSGLDATSPLRQLTIVDGTLDYDDATGLGASLTAINATLELPDLRRAASIQGSARWQDQPFVLYAALDSPGALIAGEAANARIVLESNVLRGTYDGSVRQLDGLAANGQLSLSTSSVTELAQLFGLPTGRMPRIGAASIASSAGFARGALTLGDVALTVNGNEGVGALSLALGGDRPAVQATLAFDALDVGNTIDAVRAIIDTSRLAPDAPLDWPKLDRIDADVRVSADQLRLVGGATSRVAASLALRDGRLDLAIGDMQLYGGRLTASFSSEMQGDAPSGSLQARVDGLALKTALGELAGINAIEGSLSGTLSLQGRGESWNALVASLTGRGSASIARGTIRGIDLSVLTAGNAAIPTLMGRLFNGSTAFTAARADLSITGPTISAPALTVTGAGYSAEMAAEASLGGPDIHARGTVELAGRRSPPASLPFEITGSWSHPVVAPAVPTP